MIESENKAAITAARQGFEAAFAEQHFYAKQTQDAEHLERILTFLPVRAGMRILDLGAGSGYLTFALAARFPDAEVTGLDIVEKTLEANRQKAAAAQLRNIRFVSYDGGVFPFADSAFDLVVSRYALHHFPEIDRSIAEVRRVLTADGYFFLSDPSPAPDDSTGFVDAFMRVKPDGHIRFYTQDAWKQICAGNGFAYRSGFDSSIRFPRKNEPAYQEIIQRYGAKNAESYAVETVGDEIFITEQVNNMLFRKSRGEAYAAQ